MVTPSMTFTLIIYSQLSLPFFSPTYQSPCSAPRCLAVLSLFPAPPSALDVSDVLHTPSYPNIPKKKSDSYQSHYTKYYLAFWEPRKIKIMYNMILVQK
jgi:hypothetical protein